MAGRQLKKTTTVEKQENKISQLKQFNKEDYIPCRSMTIGTLIMEGTKSKDPYKWTSYGDITEVQYQDLVGLVSLKSDYLFHPYFVVEDDDFLALYPKLQQFYEDQITDTDLEEILKLDNRSMVATIENLPKGAKETLKTLAAEKVFSGEIDSLSKIKALDECFGTQINLLSNLLA